MTKANEMATRPSPLEDEQLLTRCRRGDRDAREQLARACLPRVRRTVHLVYGSGPDHEDLVQNSLVRIFASLESFRGEARLTTWLDRVTVNTVRQHFRRRPLVAIFPSLEGSARAAAPAVEGPESRVAGRLLGQRIETLLRAIKPKKRIALVLSISYGYTVSEIGELVGCTTETAKKRLQHGRRELLERIRRDPRLAQALEEIGR